MDAHPNPYEAPRVVSNASPETARMDGFRWWRFLAILCVTIGLNGLRLILTWKAYGTDGYEQVGWPWAFYERGGYEGGEYFYPLLLAANVAVAIGLAYIGGRFTLPDVIHQIRRFQTWGTPQSP